MTVIVRLPAIPVDPDAGGGDLVHARPSPATSATSAARPADGAPSPGIPRARTARRPTRFPVVSTLLLAVAAGGCWLAVWRAERYDRRPPRDEALTASEPVGDAPPADGATATASGVDGSVVR